MEKGEKRNREEYRKQLPDLLAATIVLEFEVIRNPS